VTELPHTRTRMLHWISTAVALAAVVGASALLQPSDATAHPTTTGADALAPPDAAKAHYPLNCGREGPATGSRIDVVDQGVADFDGDGRRETVADVRCHATAGTPPNGLFVLANPPRPSATDARPRVVATMVPIKERMNVRNLKVSGRGVSATLFGYSSPDVPRCCPDRQRKVKWQWKDGQFVLKAEPVPGGAQSV
jgi:hypothetical protein